MRRPGHHLGQSPTWDRKRSLGSRPAPQGERAGRGSPREHADRAHSRVGRPLQPRLYVLGRGAQFYEGRPLPSPSPAGKHQRFHAETQVPETSPQGAGLGQPQGGPGDLGGEEGLSANLRVFESSTGAEQRVGGDDTATRPDLTRK